MKKKNRNFELEKIEKLFTKEKNYFYEKIIIKSNHKLA